MMGRLKSDQGQLFYEFHLSDAVPEDHLVRKIDTALDLSWLRTELAPHYSSMERARFDKLFNAEGEQHRVLRYFRPRAYSRECR
jgi:hypothetical protein